MADVSIPGDPGGLSDLAAQLRAAAGQIDAVGGRVGENGLQGSWSGQAAEAFRSSLQPLPGELRQASTAFDDAGRALATFASKLAELQQRARWYEQQIETARQEQWDAQLRQERAQTELDAARLRHSAASDPASLHTAKQAVDLGESTVRQAVSEVEDAVGRIASLISTTVTLREEYEAAVSSCCGALEGVRHGGGFRLAGIGSAVFGLVGGLGGELGVLWRAGGERAVDGFDDLFGLADPLADFVEGVLPVSALGAWATPIVRVANNPLFRGASRVFTAYDTIKDVDAAYGESKGETLLGRAFTMKMAAASDLVLLVPEVDVSNLASGGSLSADVKGIGVIGGHAISGGIRGVESAFQHDKADRASGNYLGLAGHVIGGGASGLGKGALKGDDQFSENALSGKYGGGVKYIAKGENYAIEKAYPVISAGGHAVSAGGHAVGSFAKGAWHEGGHLLSKL